MSQQSKRKRESLVAYEDTDSDFDSDSDSDSDDFDDDIESEANLYLGSSSDESNDEDDTFENSSEDEDTWTNVPADFTHRKQLPEFKQPVTTYDENTTPIEIFFKIFPKSLFMWISTCTNQRLDILGEEKNKKIPHTDFHEIMMAIGCMLVMSYNRVPHVSMYFSQNKAVENRLIKSAFARDRFMLVMSKLYFNNPVKPDGASKTYYMDELVNCIKFTFSRERSEASFQSIDETMILFKGRSTMKQRMPKKPIRDGLKVWQRSDAKSGYSYDFNIYRGKETNLVEGTLGEWVVKKLCSTIRDIDVAIYTDRFFTSVNLMKTIPFPCVGTVMKNLRNLPIMSKKLNRGDSEAKCTKDGIVCFKWRDSKEFMLLSNCHDSTISTVDRKQKDGTMKTFDCPEAIVSYNKYMGGVDLTDQFTTIYDIDRKSNKWWKRTFQRFLMTAVTNSWILYQEAQGIEMPLIKFLMPLSENLIEIGKSGSQYKRKMGSGRPSKRSKLIKNAGHMPISTTMRRCRRCALNKVEKRTRMMCSECDVPLCIDCYALYHK